MHFAEDQPLERSAFDAALPDEWPTDLSQQVHQQVRDCGRKLIVLDDDPTGGQTVRDLDELLTWDLELLKEALLDLSPTVFLLTNTRSLPRAEAVEQLQNLAALLAAAAAETSCDFDVLVRGDSTLRGHYPHETDIVGEVLEMHLQDSYDGTILCPFFYEGGRLSAGDMHWVAEGDTLVPAAQTEFARDTTFGYRRSDLKYWVEEKTKGRVRAADVLSISLDTIRQKGPDGVRDLLGEMGPDRVAVVNAVSYRDLDVFILGLLAAQAQDQRFLFRTSASFVRARSGLGQGALLTAGELTSPAQQSTGGLVVVGSYVEKTTRQLNALLALDAVEGIELKVEDVLNDALREGEVQRTANAANAAIAAGRDAVVYTSRVRESDRQQAGDLHVGERVSSALVKTVGQIDRQPRFFIAKGGITSSDVATHGLQARRVRILGQILPGVPVWKLGGESRFSGMAYVVFPGNVGTEKSLAQAVAKCRGTELK